MSYIANSSLPEEEVCYRIGLHWLVWLASILVTLALLAVLAALVAYGVTVWLWAVPVVLISFAWYPFISLERGVTTRRVVQKTGIFNVETEEMQLPALETVEFERSLLGHIFRYGTIELTGRGVSDLRFEMVPDPYAVKKAVERAQKVWREGKGAG